MLIMALYVRPGPRLPPSGCACLTATLAPIPGTFQRGVDVVTHMEFGGCPYLEINQAASGRVTTSVVQARTRSAGVQICRARFRVVGVRCDRP
jgi:hypothetical protein